MKQTTTAKLADISAELNAEFPERRDAIEVLTLGMLTGQHTFLLGPPGTAKSLLARSFVERFTGASYFETLLSKNRPDQAVLGPWDLNELRSNSNFVRKDNGFLTTVDVVFLDELGKMSPTLGHDLLAALNERVKHQVSNSRSAHKIPLHMAVTASNELPAAESEDAAALWDRILLRAQVDYLADSDDFKALLTHRALAEPATIPFEEIKFARQDIDAVTITDEVMDAIVSIRAKLKADHQLIFSDRRWRDSVAVLRASAFLRGDDTVNLEDLLAYRHILWNTPSEVAQMSRVVMQIASPESEELLDAADAMDSLEAEIEEAKGKSETEFLNLVMAQRSKAAKARRTAERAKKNSTSIRVQDEADAILRRVRKWTESLEAVNPLKGF